MTTVLTDYFKTRLGTLVCQLASDHQRPVANQSIHAVQTISHQITLEIFELQPDSLPDEISVETSKVWRWFIRKTNNQAENLQILCQFKPEILALNYHGQDNDFFKALTINDDKNILYVGTENRLLHWERATTADWFPERFKTNNWESFPSFSTIWEMAVHLQVPQLEVGEKVYFQVIAALSSNQGNDIQNFPEEISHRKSDLDQYLGKGNL